MKRLALILLALAWLYPGCAGLTPSTVQGLDMIPLAPGWTEEWSEVPTCPVNADQAGSYAWADGFHATNGTAYGGRITYYHGWWEGAHYFTQIHERAHAQGWNRGVPMADCPRTDCIMAEAKGPEVWEGIVAASLKRGSWFCEDCRARLLGIIDQAVREP